MITLNRPEKRNAITMEMMDELVAVLDAAAKSTARVVIMTGAGKAFCAGMDIEGLSTIADQGPKERMEDTHRIAKMFKSIYAFPKPLIAAVNGAAVAGGCGIATLADFTIAVPEAKFGYTEVKSGVSPALVAVFLTRQVCAKHARDLLLTGKIIDAAEAYRMGLVTEVVPAADLMTRVGQIAESLLAVSPSGVVRTKHLLLEFEAAALDRDIASAIEENSNIRATADFKEGVTSFLEKRKPIWTGR